MADNTQHIEFLARGLLVERGTVLLCRNIAGDYHYLPGGHIEFGEAPAEALKREMLEETGLDVHVNEPVLICEQRFRQPNSKGKLRERHELTILLPMRFLSPPPPTDPAPVPVQSLEPDIAFDWIDLAAIPDTDLRPLATKAFLASGGASRSAVAWLSEDHRP